MDAALLLVQQLQARHGTTSIRLCDSGTSALILAIRAAVPRDGTVAFPSYGCIDLAAAARFAGVRVRLYDLDPTTLSADLESLASTLDRGVDAVIAVHLFGYPADVPAMKKLAGAHGVPLIEDAAQGASASLNGKVVGGLGDISILSFGRGKGTTGGRGGAVMTSEESWAARLVEQAGGGQPVRAHGWGDLTRAAAQWMLGRPRVYAIPSAIPGLQLGEMVYHTAHEPMPMSRAAAALVCAALQLDEAEVGRRRQSAAVVEDMVRNSARVLPVRAIPGAEPGYLRYPVIDLGRRMAAPSIGVVRGYPLALFEQPELRSQLRDDEREPLGGRRLRESLFTLPVHGLVTRRDITQLRRWLEEPSSR